MQPYGIQSMLKEGHKHLSGLDEAVLKNVEACKQLSQITRTSLGPNGMPFFPPSVLFCFFFFSSAVLDLQIILHFCSRVLAFMPFKIIWNFIQI